MPLARHLLVRVAAEQGREDLEGWEPEVERWLLAQPWRGNVRELGNTLERGVVLSAGPRLSVADLELPVGPLSGAGSGDSLDLPLYAWLDRQTEQRIRAVLAEVGHVRAEAAARLGIDRTTLYRLMKRLGID